MAQGYIAAINEKDTVAGKMYDFVIDGRKIGAGKFPPKGFAAGDYVNYEAEQKGNFLNLRSGSMSKATPPAGVPAPSAAPARAGGALGGFDSRQEVISKQAAANTTLAWLTFLGTQDAIPVPAKAAKDKKADLLEAVFYEYMGKFYKLATGQDLELPDPTAKDLSSAEEGDNWQE